MGLQTTLRNRIQCAGVGLHTGEDVRMVLRPAGPNTGIVFRRTDVDPETGVVPAKYDLVSHTTLGTTITNAHGVGVATVEHLMAALAGLEVDNAIVELNGPEVPIMDGSAAPFVFLIECAGIDEIDEPRKVIEVLKPICVRDGDKFARVEPHDGFEVDIQIDFDSQAIRSQRCRLDLAPETFTAVMAKARTFGFLEDVSRLQAAGLARGGSLENSIVIDGDRVLNKNGLRFPDEFVRHKALDVVGDLSLAGHRLMARVSAFKPGHGLNNSILRALFADNTAWRYGSDNAGKTSAAIDDYTPPMVVNY